MAAPASRSGPARQPALPFELREQYTFERFFTADNAELVARLQSEEAAFSCLWLYGASGLGKTHLLHAVCHRFPNACYVPAPVVSAAANNLHGYARFGTVTVDDVEHWLANRDAEVAVFDFYNRLRMAEACLIVTAEHSPLDCGFALPDLRSRLCAAACYRLAPVPEEDKPALLVEAAKARGLRLGEDVVRFLLARVSRDQRQLLRLLDELDRSSLAAQRRLTIPFVKETLCL